jgi:ABC-type multidrug transport system fused ATPase/permease subunit
LGTNKYTLKLYWQQIRKYKPSFFTMLIFLPIAGLLLDTLLPYFLAQAVGTLTSHDGEKLYHFLLLAGTVGAVGVCL